MRECAFRRRPSRAAVRAALGLSALAVAAVLSSRPAGAAGFWQPPDFGRNTPGVVVAIGDSITLGIFRDDCHNPDCIVDRPYPAVLQSLLQSRHPGVVVRNRGLGGEDVGGGLSRLPSILASDRPGFVLIMEGTNNASSGDDPRRIVDTLRAMVRVVKAGSSIPLLGAIPPNFRDDPDARSIVGQVNAMLPGVAAEEGVRFVDIFGPLNNPGLYGSEDRLHPNQQGYEVMAAAWLPALTDAIDASRSLLEGLTLALSFDADGDGLADVAIFRADTGEWFARRSSDGVLAYQYWGAPLLGDRPVPGRYTGGAVSDIAVYRPVTGEWFIRRSTDDGGLTQFPWGSPFLDDVPVPADYDGDGRTDIAVFRRATGEWFVHRSTDATLAYQYWGAPTLGDVPIPADYDGDGKADVAVYRSTTGEWFILRSSDGGLTQVPWGCPSCRDRPVPGHYDSSPGARVAVYRPGTGEWFIFRADGTLLQLPWGAPTLGDVPVPANYTDGTPARITDVAVYRTSTGQWFIHRSTDGSLTLVPWGAPTLGDVPVIGPPPLP